MIFRKPRKDDGKAIFDLVRTCAPPLDLNSAYLYCIIGEHFSETSIVADFNGSIAGFISAYLVPERKNCLFVWQVAVSSEHRGKGVARSMLDAIVSRPVCREISYLETTITTSNEASKALFTGLAKGRGLSFSKETFVLSENFGLQDHEQEILYRIGPFRQ